MVATNHHRQVRGITRGVLASTSEKAYLNGKNLIPYFCVLCEKKWASLGLA
jgi:hypothetical protein